MKRATKYFCLEAGFTLTELLIVIAIISVLATGLIVVLNPIGQIQKANDAKRKSDLQQVQKALEQYYNDVGMYPTNTPGFQIQGAPWGGPWSNYIQILPSDPTATKTYVYISPAGQQSYWLYASLDNIKDLQICVGGTCPNATAHNAGNSCGGKCNYGVASSNTTP